MRYGNQVTTRLRFASALVFTLAVGSAAEPAAENFTAAARGYWAFQPIERPAPPQLGETNVAQPIDAFLTEKLAAKGLSLSSQADKRTLIRRAYFDLTGLPPSPQEVVEFEADASPEAFAKVVERLLESPRYGERWGRHWLDLARYAESEGFKADETRPNAWSYRDYVINAFNEDKPYDRFVKEQIAGDELYPADPWARIGTAFSRNYADESNGANMLQRRQEVLQDITDTVALTFMGMTVGCAKCHDHKFDPILQKDYYRLQAFFSHTTINDEIPIMSRGEHAEYQRKLAVWEQASADIRAEIQALIEPKRQEIIDVRFERYPSELQEYLNTPEEDRSPFEKLMYHKFQWQMEFLTSDAKIIRSFKGEAKNEYDTLAATLAEFDHLHPGDLPLGVGMEDLGTEAPPTHVLTLANYTAKEEQVEPGFLSILQPEPAKYEPPKGMQSTGRRTALANWLASPENPLTARVMVNRIWHHHFGRGIVATPSDFGWMGDQPTHPELLNWLADEFVQNGWSVKQMHRLIMNSAAYQQSSDHNAGAGKKDPMNRLLWRFRPQRLDAETIRDSSLAVAGTLNTKMGGPSVFPPLPEGMPEPRGGWELSENSDDHYRRSVYVFVRRNSPYHMLNVMDMPNTHESCARRESTITAPQALAYINSNVTMDWAQRFAGRVLESAAENPAERVDLAYRLAFQRPADGEEKDSGLTFLSKHSKVIEARIDADEPVALPTFLPQGMTQAEGAAFTDFTHTILNSNEFVFAF